MSSSNNMTPGTNSLVKYANAVLVSTSGKGKKEKGRESQKTGNTHTEDILNSILPPREYTMDKQQLWIQSVLPTPATKADVLQLQQDLENRLQQRQARETGICPIREELYAQCFDELIRQITIDCAERGLLLVRVRDEIRMTIQAYQTLYESSIAYGMRKALQAEQKKEEMNSRIKSLEVNNTDLDQQVLDLETKIKEIEENDLLQQQEAQKNHNDQVTSLKRQNEKIKEKLKEILSPQKK